MSGRHARRGVAHAIRAGAGAALLAGVVALAAAVVVVPRLTGAVPLTVLTSSMEPAYPPGTLVIVRPVDPDDVRIGDVITYQLESGRPEVVTHRVVAVTTDTSGERTFRAQGDNNAQPDPAPVVAGQIQGAVWYAVPWIGWVATGVDPHVKSWVTVAIACGLFGYTTFTVASWARDRGRRGLT